MRPLTILKIAGAILAVLLLVAGCGVLAAINSLRDPPFDPPEVAPLGPNAQFEADRVARTGAGYTVAGVVGTSDPLRGRPCSGRFALLFLDERGRPTTAAVLSGPERSRFCADRVDALVNGSDGTWFVAGTAVRDGGPSGLFPGKPSTDTQYVTFRVDARGALVEGFGDGGILEDHRVAGRVTGAVFTTDLERLTESGDVRDDLVAGQVRGSRFEVDDELLVAVSFGSGLTFRTLERDAPDVAVYRPLHSLPVYQTEPTVDVGSDVSVSDSLLLDGVLYVAVRDTAGTRINAIDPRRLRVDFGFNGTGAVRLRGGYVTSVRLLSDEAGRIIAVTTVIDRGHPGDRLHVLRFAADGTQDASFGGRVKRNGRDVNLDPGLDDAILDPEGRTVALGGGSTSIVQRESRLARLDESGKLDPSFGEDGVVRLGAVRVCELIPAATAAACRS
jgi:Domain of unknown function (DUF5122) beta-propeller